MTQLRVERINDRGAARIPGWIDGETKAIITHKGTDGSGPWTKEYTNEREAMQALGAIEIYVNIELVSATLERM